MSAELAAMRAFVADLLAGRPLGTPPPVALVKANHLGPLAYRMGMSELRDEYAASVIMTDRRAAMLREVTAALAARGIEVALLKGISFTGTIYPDPATRPMNDVDVLIRVAALPAAIEVLRALGFERHGYERKLSDFYHAIAWRRGDQMIELHRNMMQRHRTRTDLDGIWTRAARDPLGSGALRLDPIDELLMCILHIARSELNVPALNYVDTQRLWLRLTAAERGELRARARSWRVARAVDAVLSMTALLAAGAPGRPAAVLASTDDVVLARRPARPRQIAQKLWLVQGPREGAGLALAWLGSIVQGWYRSRDE